MKEKPKDEYVGPDTSSLTAFLVSLLSLSEPSAPYDDEKAADGSDSEEGASAASSQSILEEVGQEFEQEASFIVEPGLALAKCEKEYLPSTSGGDELDSDWQLVSENDFVMNSRYFDPPPVQAMQQEVELPRLQLPPQPKPGPVKLPAMSEVSSLLPEDLRNAIYPSLPTLAKGRQWVLLYRYVWAVT